MCNRTVGNDLSSAYDARHTATVAKNCGVAMSRNMRGHPRARAKFAVALASVAAVFGLSVAVALGAPQFTSDGASWKLPATGDLEISDEEMFDLQTVADDEGISLDEAIERYGWQNAFALGVTELQEEFPGSFSSATMGSGGVGPSISFKGKAPEALATILGDLPIDVRIIENVAWSEKELIEAGQAIHYAVQSFGGTYDVQTDIDAVSGTVTVSTDAPQSRTNLIDRPSVRAATELLPEGTHVFFEEVPSLTGGDDTVHGE